LHAQTSPAIKKSIDAPLNVIIPPSALPAPVPSKLTFPLPSDELPTPSLHLAKSWANKNILSVTQFSRDDNHALFSIASEMKMVVKRVGTMELCKGKVLATLFYEPSTRTCCSFAAAMERLGGSVVTVNEQFSSTQKGETLTDTIHCLESYTDAIVLRHPQKGSAALAAKVASKPIINAGDGTGEHPTQALLDVFTIREELGTVNGLTITLVGDLKNGRTVHSLVRMLALYKVTLNYVAPTSLSMPQDVKDFVHDKHIPQNEYTHLDDVLPETDVLYVTRIQKERFENLEEYEKVKSVFCITPKTLTHCKSRMAILHPLPRTTEISTEVDTDPRAAYFRQMENGMYVRMALLAMIFGKV
jgi:aspartate carbamoyltransferase